ncbi:MAG: hypothetical protein FWH44_01115 [Methanomassiliicoccaceae archaeon]|nr:hypothetical protein [Methanomassiliicoccaceae archaeon]
MDASDPSSGPLPPEDIADSIKEARQWVSTSALTEDQKKDVLREIDEIERIAKGDGEPKKKKNTILETIEGIARLSVELANFLVYLIP